MTARTAAPPILAVLFDSREQIPWDPLPGVTMTKATLSEGDYTTARLQGVAVVERKSIHDFASSITWGRERLDDEVRRLRGYRWRCVIVEGEISEVWRVARIHPHAVLGTCASFYSRADCPVLFAGTRAGAARLAFGILRRWEERLAGEGGQAA
jgi:DNA excision repair protein ERCC-4